MDKIMKQICGWTDIGSPNKPYPIYKYTEKAIQTTVWFDNVSQSDARKLVSWWNTHSSAYDFSRIHPSINLAKKHRYQVIQDKTIYV